MGNSANRLVEKPQEEGENLVSPSPASAAPASNLDPASVKTLDHELQNQGLEDNESRKKGENKKQNNNLEGDSIVKGGKSKISEYPVRPDKLDCSVYLRTGQNQGLEDNENRKMGENKKQNNNLEGDSIVKGEKSKISQSPLRPDKLDCAVYLRTGKCRYGSNCRFNHPPGRKDQVRSLSDSLESVQIVKEKEKNEEEYPERAGLPECKNNARKGGCKVGKARRQHHPREKTAVGPRLEFNFLGLPIRPGKRECPFYMRMGSCKFAINCRFHHPDPTAAAGSDPLSGYQNGGPVPLHMSGASQPDETSWPLPGASSEPVLCFDSSPTYVPMMSSPPQGMHPNLEWNEYQAPVSSLYPPPEGNMHPPSASVLNDSTKNAGGSTYHQQQMHDDEFPERPGQRECKYFMKNGDCKNRSARRSRHSKNRISKSPVLSPMGLPLRPEQTICSQYNRQGICKYGSACKYDHPPNLVPSSSSTGPASNELLSFDESETLGGWV